MSRSLILLPECIGRLNTKSYDTAYFMELVPGSGILARVNASLRVRREAPLWGPMVGATSNLCLVFRVLDLGQHGYLWQWAHRRSKRRTGNMSRANESIAPRRKHHNALIATIA